MWNASTICFSISIALYFNFASNLKLLSYVIIRSCLRKTVEMGFSSSTPVFSWLPWKRAIKKESKLNFWVLNEILSELNTIDFSFIIQLLLSQFIVYYQSLTSSIFLQSWCKFTPCQLKVQFLNKFTLAVSHLLLVFQAGLQPTRAAVWFTVIYF